jgi:transcriptional regulator with XRE-family HTH domain
LRKPELILSENLKAEMARLNWDYNDLAKASGLTRSGVYKIVEAITWPWADNLRRVAEAVGRSVGWLLTDHVAEKAERQDLQALYSALADPQGKELIEAALRMYSLQSKVPSSKPRRKAE